MTDDLTITEEPFDGPDSQLLRAELRAEIVARDGVHDEPGVPPTADEVSVFLVARVDGGMPAGCGAIRMLDDGAAELKRMYVRPAARGRGIGRGILQMLERRALELGAARIVLETSEGLTEAVAMYERAGYVRTERFGPYVECNESACFERRW